MPSPVFIIYRHFDYYHSEQCAVFAVKKREKKKKRNELFFSCPFPENKEDKEKSEQGWTFLDLLL